MFNKKTSYEVNVQDITFWRKKINVDNTEVFVRECLNDPFMLYLDKVKGDNYGRYKENKKITYWYGLHICRRHRN